MYLYRSKLCRVQTRSCTDAFWWYRWI